MAGSRPTILQIIPRLDTGGAELSAIEIAGAIVAAGGRALVATEGGRMAERVTACGGELVILPAGSKNPVQMALNARRLAALARREDVRLIHARSRAPAWSALAASRRLGVPFVTTYHGAYNEHGRLKRLYNGVMARADVVIANSDYTRALVLARYAPPPGRVVTIHRGVDVAHFDPATVAPERVARLRAAWGAAPGQPVILQAARLTSWKGQDVAIAALARLVEASPEALLVLAGDDQGRTAYRESLEAAARAAGIADRVHLAGHVDDMPAAFMTARVALVASIEPEAFGRTATEAQAMGCPVIATDIGAPRETVIPWTGPDAASAATGWLVPPGDAEALARAVSAALGLDEGARHALAARARRNVLEKFSLDSMRRATLAVYDRLLGSDLAERLAPGGTPRV